jgi:sugar lactone lactonase YvrE
MKKRAVAASFLIAVSGSASMALPPSTLTKLYQQGNVVPGMGQISSPFFSSSGCSIGGASFISMGVNDAGNALIACNVYACPPFTQAVLNPTQGLTPVLAAGYLPPSPGALGLPTTDYAMRSLLGIKLSNAGTPAFLLGAGEGDFGPAVPAITEVTFGTQGVVAVEGGSASAPGLDPGAMFSTFGSNVLGVNDSNVFLVGAVINENAVLRNALLKIQTNGSGVVLSRTLVAKEGGLVGGGPSTWTSLSISINSAAINNAGQVVFSGITSAGVEGVFKDGVLVASRGGSTPVVGMSWGALLGASVDINSSGQVAIRALAGSSEAWTEVGDAGSSYASAQQTTAGSLSTIVGTLTDSHDVDLYRIRIENYGAFSATTVPAPGFPGSTGDTVLYLLRNFENANGITRTLLARSDDAAPGVIQSTLTSANIPPDTANGTSDYYLAVATPKVRPVNTQGREFWYNDPSALAIANGKLYWSDPSDGAIRRASLSNGNIDPAFTVAAVPAPYPGQIQGTAEILTPPIAVYDNGASRFMLWHSSLFAQEKMRRADADAGLFTILDVVVSPPVPSVGISNVTGMAVDTPNARYFWSRATSTSGGVLNFGNVDGSSSQTLIASGVAPRDLAVDSANQRIYWTDTTNSRVQRCNIDGQPVVIETLASGVSAGGIAVDSLGNKVYWSVPASGTIRRSNLDGSSPETFKSGLPVTATTYYPADLAISGSTLYYADVVNNRILSMATTSLEPTSSVFVALGSPVGDKTTDTPSRLDSLSSWQSNGVVGAGLSYQVRLTGASAYNPQAMVARDNLVKVAMVGDAPAAVSPNTLLTVGSLGGPVRISDAGLVAYRATWSSLTGIMLGNEIAVSSSRIPANHPTSVGAVNAGPHGFDMSDSGQHIVMSSDKPVFPFSAEFLASKVAFDSIPQPPCPADIDNDGSLANGLIADGGVDINDLLAFLAGFEAGDSRVDFDNGSGNGIPDGGVDINDLLFFLVHFESGC